jgi:hypothetical protein
VPPLGCLVLISAFLFLRSDISDVLLSFLILVDDCDDFFTSFTLSVIEGVFEPTSELIYFVYLFQKIMDKNLR